MPPEDVERALDRLVAYHAEQSEQERAALATMVTLLTVAVAIGAGVIAFAGLYLPRLETGRSAGEIVHPWLLGLLPAVALSPLVWSITLEGKLRLARRNMRLAERAFLERCPEKPRPGETTLDEPPPPAASARAQLQRGAFPLAPRSTTIVATIDRVVVAFIEWAGTVINFGAFITVTGVALAASGSGAVQLTMGAIYVGCVLVLTWHGARLTSSQYMAAIQERAWQDATSLDSD